MEFLTLVADWCPKGRVVVASHPAPRRTLNLNTDLTEEDFMEGAGAQRILIYGENIAIFIALNQYFKQLRAF